MIIRRIRKDDIDTIVGMGADLAIESPVFANRVFSAEKARSFVEHAAAGTDPDTVVFIIENDGEIVGLLAAFIVQSLFFEEDEAYDAVFYVRPGSRGTIPSGVFVDLLRQYKQWATSARDTTRVFISVSTGIKTARTVAMLEAFGATQCGTLLSLAGVEI